MGFAGTPVSSTLLAVGTTGPMLVSFLGVPFLFVLRMNPHILKWNQYYRFGSNSLIWTDQTSVILAVITLYNLRVVERFFGSRRFGILVAGAWATSAALTGLAAWGLSTIFNVNLLFQSGAIGLTSALLAWYVQLVPPTYYLKIGHATVSDKFVTYLMFTLMLRDWGDIVKASAGYAAKILVGFLL